MTSAKRLVTMKNFAARRPRGARPSSRLPIIIDLAETTARSAVIHELRALPPPLPQRAKWSDSAALRRSELLLAEAQHVAHLGNWSRDLRSNELFWSDELYRIFGFRPRDIPPTFDLFLSLLQPDARERVRKIVAQALRDGTPYKFSLRVLRPGGMMRDVDIRGFVECDEASSPIRSFGTVQDVTELRESEQTLRASEERVRMLLDSTAEAIYGVDLDGNCIFTNPAFLRLLGYKDPGDLLGRPMHALLHHARGVASRCPKEACEVLRSFQLNQELHTDGVVLWRDDGTGFPAEYWCHPIRRGGKIVGAVSTFLDITERRRLERAVLEISEKERRRLGQDLHDDLCQQLAGIALTGRLLEQRLAAGSNPEGALATKIVKAARQATERARDLAKGLHPTKLETVGLVPSLRELSKSVVSVFHISCRFRCRSPERSMKLVNSATMIQLYRIAQESSTNAVKHGGAKNISISIGLVGKRIRLTIADNGTGIGSVPPSGGMGLPVMQQRARVIGADLTISRRRRGGTLVTCSLPAPNKAVSKKRMKPSAVPHSHL